MTRANHKTVGNTVHKKVKSVTADGAVPRSKLHFTAVKRALSFNGNGKSHILTY